MGKSKLGQQLAYTVVAFVTIGDPGDFFIQAVATIHYCDVSHRLLRDVDNVGSIKARLRKQTNGNPWCVEFISEYIKTFPLFLDIGMEQVLKPFPFGRQ